MFGKGKIKKTERTSIESLMLSIEDALYKLDVLDEKYDEDFGGFLKDFGIKLAESLKKIAYPISIAYGTADASFRLFAEKCFRKAGVRWENKYMPNFKQGYYEEVKIVSRYAGEERQFAYYFTEKGTFELKELLRPGIKRVLDTWSLVEWKIEYGLMGIRVLFGVILEQLRDMIKDARDIQKDEKK